jgi:glucose-6-phosphate 1-epimerase
LAVDHIAQVSLQGQATQPEWDAIKDTHQTCTGELRFEAEFDRVYDVNTMKQPTWTLQDGAAFLQISQSPSWDQSVVWNPGADKCAQLNDMPADGYQHMLCVEAARVTSAIQVPPAQTWAGWQLLKI